MELQKIGSIGSPGHGRMIWSREAGDEIFAHAEDRQGCMVKGTAGWWRTRCPIQAAHRMGILDVQGPYLPPAQGRT